MHPGTGNSCGRTTNNTGEAGQHPPPRSPEDDYLSAAIGLWAENAELLSSSPLMLVVIPPDPGFDDGLPSASGERLGSAPAPREEARRELCTRRRGGRRWGSGRGMRAHAPLTWRSSLVLVPGDPRAIISGDAVPTASDDMTCLNSTRILSAARPLDTGPAIISESSNWPIARLAAVLTTCSSAWSACKRGGDCGRAGELHSRASDAPLPTPAASRSPP